MGVLTTSEYQAGGTLRARRIPGGWHLEREGGRLRLAGVEVPPYTTPESDAERRAREAFGDEVIDRLFVLNLAGH